MIANLHDMILMRYATIQKNGKIVGKSEKRRN